MEVVCDTCGKSFKKKKSEVARTKNNFCSRECSSEHKKIRFCKVCGKKTDNLYCDEHKIVVNNSVIVTPCGKTISKQNKLGCTLVKKLRRLNIIPSKVEMNKYVSLYPANYFLKVIYHKDELFIRYMKDRIKSMLRNTKNRVEKIYTKYGEMDNDLTTDFLYSLWEEQKHKCALSGIPIIFANDDFPYHFRASIDRIDNTKGYIKGNVQLVSLPLNYAKNRTNDFTIKKLIKVIKQYN